MSTLIHYAQGERTDPDSDVGWIRGGPCGYNPCVEIKSSNLIFMILLLFLMVALVITTVHLCGWRLLIKLGYMMMLFYFIFLAVSLLLETGTLFSSC